MALQCSGEGHEPPKNRVGFSFGAFQTRLVLGDLGDDVPLSEAAVGLSFERRISSKITLQVNAGGITTGHVLADSPEFHGGFLGGGVSWNVLDQKGARPFVMLGLSLSASIAGYPRNSSILYAADIRGSATVGYSDGRWTGYAVGRLFGGPVVFVQPGATSLGTDRYHFQLGIGGVLSLPRGFDVSLELVPFGEQRVSAGVGYSF